MHVAGSECPDRLAPEIEITLFRVAQEALTNVAKHAHATHVDVELDHAGHECVMSITDNGIGIRRAHDRGTSQRPRLGVVTMRERTQTIGGRFEVRAAPNRGTQVIITIP